MKTVDILGADKFIIKFDYDPTVVAQVRCLPQGRRWVPEFKAWICPISVEALELLRGYGFDILPNVAKWEQEWLKPTKPAVRFIDDIPGLKHPLYPFQAEGVGFIEDRGGRALLADEMGLGKTVQALAWLQLHPEALPALVVCPCSLKGNWERECHTWTTLKTRVLSGTKSDASQTGQDVLIINYDILQHWLPALDNVDTVVLDECHFCKDSKTLRTKAVKALCKGKKHVIALSGTPIVNRPVEFWNTLNILAPTAFDKYWDYTQRYCGAKHNGYGWDVTGASNTDELHQRLSGNIMIRRLKADVLKDLPPKIQTTIPLELDSYGQSIYDDALREAFGVWDNEKPDPLNDITAIGHLRRTAITAKLELCYEWLDNFLETGNKIVVFDIHHSTTDKLMERYGKIAIALDGRTDVRIRSKVVEQFQTDPAIKMLIGNVQVAGMGFTLTAAQDAVFLEYPWTPSEISQCEDRIHRIGQTGAASIYYLVAAGTLEEDIIELIGKKRKVLDGILDGIIDESKSMMKKLIEKIKMKGRR